jgi:hypothetical protein
MVASGQTTKKTLVASIVASAIVAYVCVAKQRLRLRPQRARHNIYKTITIVWQYVSLDQSVSIAENSQEIPKPI